MDNVFISESNENTLKMTPTDVMANRHLKCRCIHSDSRVRAHTHARTSFRHTSLGAAGFVVV